MWLLYIAGDDLEQELTNLSFRKQNNLLFECLVNSLCNSKEPCFHKLWSGYSNFRSYILVTVNVIYQIFRLHLTIRFWNDSWFLPSNGKFPLPSLNSVTNTTLQRIHKHNYYICFWFFLEYNSDSAWTNLHLSETTAGKYLS